MIKIKKYFVFALFIMTMEVTEIARSEERPCWLDATQMNGAMTLEILFKASFLATDLDDPIGDARARVDIGDLRLIAVGVPLGVEYPGIDKITNDDLICKLGTRSYPGALHFDLGRSDEMARGIAKLRIYAVDYNQYIRDHYREGLDRL